MTQPPLFGPPPDDRPLPPAKMAYDKPAAPVGVLRGRARSCSACGALIVFPLVAKRVGGREQMRPMPVDVEPDPAGNVHVWAEGRVLRGHVFGRRQDRAGRADLHKSHFTTCPDAGRFRQRGDDR